MARTRNEWPVRLLALAATAYSALGQAPGKPYEALQQALGLTDVQLWQIQQEKPLAVVNNSPVLAGAQTGFYPARRQAQTRDSLHPAMEDPRQMELLDETQRAKLTAIEKVLDRREMASQAISLGLMKASEWLGTALCHSRIEAARSELDLTEAQVAEFEAIEQAARQPVEQEIWQKMDEHLALLHSGSSEDSPAVVEVMAGIARLQKQFNEIKPPRDLAMAVLDDVQKAKLAEFESTLQLAREAIELRLFYPVRGEVLCN